MFTFIFALLFNYLIPFLLAIGLIFFIYGIIKYFILGPGEEPAREEGRVYFIKANVWFFFALVLFFVLSAFQGLINWTKNLSIDVDANKEEELLIVPNVPRRDE